MNISWWAQVFNGTNVTLSLDTADSDMLAMFEVLSYRLDQIHLGVSRVRQKILLRK